MKKVVLILLVAIPGLQVDTHARGMSRPKNTIGLNTIQLVNSHIGFGVYYERSLSDNGKFSLVLPVSVAWESYANSNEFQAPNTVYTSVAFNPGLKFYPFGNRKFFSYATGLSAFSQMGRSSKIYGNLSTQPVNGPLRDYDFYTAGIYINNYLNFKINKHLSFGFEIGIGPSVINNFSPEDGSITVKGGTLIYQNIAFQIAYQF